MSNEEGSRYQVSTQTASMLTGKNVRTLQRWQSEKGIQATQVDSGRRGVGTVKLMIDLSSLAPYIPVPLDDAKMKRIAVADTGDADAQNDVGLYFFMAEEYGIAFSWFEAAASKGHADAMDWLAACYLKAYGVSGSPALGLKWLGEAAAHGHAIAQFKIDSMNLK